MKREDLFLLHCIFNSDDDADIVNDIYAGYDEDFNLIILMEHTDYDDPQYNCDAYAVVGKDEAYDLSKRLGVPMTRLIDVIENAVSDYDNFVNPTLRQTRDCFSDILQFVRDNGGRSRLYRTYGAYGYTCF